MSDAAVGDGEHLGVARHRVAGPLLAQGDGMFIVPGSGQMMSEQFRLMLNHVREILRQGKRDAAMQFLAAGA
jgi:hypothetical protein